MNAGRAHRCASDVAIGAGNRMRNQWHHRTQYAAFIGILIVGWPNAVFGQTQFDSSFLKAAREERNINYYGAPDLGLTLGPLFKLFQQRYGVEVVFTGARGRENYDRVLSEQRAGRYLADVMSTGATSMNALKWKGALVPYSPPNLEQIAETFRDRDHVLIPVYLNIYGLLINTALVKRDEEPRSWKDLLDGRWKGKILADDPRGAGGGNVWFTVVYKALGKSYLEAMARQEPQFRPQYLENEKAVARGEYPIYLPALAGSIARLKGAPVKWIAPSEGVTYALISQGLIKNAPHSNAAKLWIDFQMGPEAQTALAKGGDTPLRSDVAVPYPELSFRGKKLLGTTTAEDLKQGAKFSRLAEQIFFAR
jgi:iron(III) transport system substrate-binding protein